MIDIAFNALSKIWTRRHVIGRRKTFLDADWLVFVSGALRSTGDVFPSRSETDWARMAAGGG